MAKFFGIEVSRRAIVLSQVHNVVEIVTMVLWLRDVLAGNPVRGVIILVVGLTVEHVLALAAGKVA